MSDLISQLFKNNEAYAHTHEPAIAFSEFPDMKAVMIVSCMDPRADPNEIFNTGAMGPAVIRNAGGRATEDVLRSIRVLSGIMSNGRNTVGAVIVVHHSDCGLSSFSNDEIARLLKERAELNDERAAEVAIMDFGSVKGDASLEKGVLEDMKIIKDDPYLPKEIAVIGVTYDIFSGKATQVAQM